MDQETPTTPARSGRSRRVAIAAGLLTAVAAAGFVGYSRFSAPASADGGKPATKDDKKAKEPPVVAVIPVATGPISAYIQATANLVAEDEVKVVAEAEGKVVQLLVEEGDSVRKGQKLVQIDKADPTLAVQKAELALRKAQMDFERAETMAGEKLISPQEQDKSRYERDVAGHALEEARYRLDKTAVLAPFDGKITVRKVQPGQAVKLGEELFTIADFEPLVARIFLPEREVLDLKVGQQAQLTLKAREDVRFAGRIRQVSPVVDAASGTVKVTIEAVRPPASVRPGAFVSVGVVRETRPGALLVPRAAVVRELQETFVYVAEGTKARKVVVQVGLEEEGRLEITSGLKAGDKVIVSGHGGLKDQAVVKLASS